MCFVLITEVEIESPSFLLYSQKRVSSARPLTFWPRVKVFVPRCALRSLLVIRLVSSFIWLFKDDILSDGCLAEISITTMQVRLCAIWCSIKNPHNPHKCHRFSGGYICSTYIC